MRDSIESVGNLLRQVEQCVMDVRKDNVKLKDAIQQASDKAQLLRTLVYSILEARKNSQEVNWENWVSLAEKALKE